MYTENRNFTPPKDKNVKIWRYMDFIKFVALIDSKQLYFCRSDKFEDPFEGIFPLPNLKQNKIMIDSSLKTRKFYYVNCWHMNNFESAAMWKIYLESKNGIAIQSTFSKLTESFTNTQETVYASIVKYADYEAQTMMDLIKANEVYENAPMSTINQHCYKRKSFEHENELRAFYVDFPLDESRANELANGKFISLNLNTLIEKVYVAPFADSWFFDLVASICHKFGIEAEITQSNLFSFDYSL